MAITIPPLSCTSFSAVVVANDFLGTIVAGRCSGREGRNAIISFNRTRPAKSVLMPLTRELLVISFLVLSSTLRYLLRSYFLRFGITASRWKMCSGKVVRQRRHPASAAACLETTVVAIGW
jgi:hypothetical protein